MCTIMPAGKPENTANITTRPDHYALTTQPPANLPLENLTTSTQRQQKCTAPPPPHLSALLCVITLQYDHTLHSLLVKHQSTTAVRHHMLHCIKPTKRHIASKTRGHSC